MANRDIAGMLTGINSTQRPNPNASSDDWRMQFGEQQAQNLNVATGKPTPEQAIQMGMGQLDLTSVKGLTTLAKMQQLRGDTVGAAKTVSMIKNIQDKEAKLTLDKSQRDENKAESLRRYNLESGRQDKRLELEEERLEEVRTGERKLLNDDIKRIADAENAAAKSAGESRQALRLLDRYNEENPLGGALGSTFGAFKKFVGGQTAVDSLKTEFDNLVNTGIIGNLPPGVASDRDIDLIRKGFPDSSWSAGEIKEFLKLQAKLSAFTTKRNEYKADYLNENRGNLSGFSKSWRNLIEEDGYADLVAKEFNLTYDLPLPDVEFNADKAALLQQAMQQQAPSLVTPSSSALSMAEAFRNK
tara:strand:+ start:24 stop:1097 length:1074 start_codon:yes stop_codon:yes gene_type:complete